MQREKQLVLDFALRNHYDFENFIVGENQLLVQNLQRIKTEDCFFLYGSASAGKTHLLSALCKFFYEQKDDLSNKAPAVAYLALDDFSNLSIEMLDGLEHYALVCIDDVDAVFGHSAWEVALFNLYNRLREQGGMLVLASSINLVQANITLPDLKSRLSAALLLQIQELDDVNKALFLQKKAMERGIKLEQDVIEFILKHSSRSMKSLLDVIEKIDKESLEQKRMITIPFLKKLFGW